MPKQQNTTELGLLSRTGSYTIIKSFSLVNSVIIGTLYSTITSMILSYRVLFLLLQIAFIPPGVRHHEMTIFVNLNCSSQRQLLADMTTLKRRVN